MNPEVIALQTERTSKRIEAVNLLRVSLPEIKDKIIAAYVKEFLDSYDELNAKVRDEVFG